MKIVQSFWSKPMTMGSDRIINAGGWYNKRLFLYGSMLSILLLDRQYPQKTIFVTDDFGNELFANKLQLPINEVIVALDELDEINPTLWALGKVYTYSLIKEHFIHFDLDFFLRIPLPNVIINAELVAYTSEFSVLKQNNIYIPNIEAFLQSVPVLGGKVQTFFLAAPRMAFNAGIIGGRNLALFTELKELSFEIISQNRGAIKETDCHFFNVVLEQFLFTCLSREGGAEVTCLVEEHMIMNSPKYTNMKYFPISPSIHLMAECKHYTNSGTCIEEILFSEFPYHYKLANDLLNKNLV